MLKKGEVHKKYYDKGLPLLRRLEVGDVVVMRKLVKESKIDDRWDEAPQVVVTVPDNGIPVYKVKNIETGKISTVVDMSSSQCVNRGRACIVV